MVWFSPSTAGRCPLSSSSKRRACWPLKFLGSLMWYVTGELTSHCSDTLGVGRLGHSPSRFSPVKRPRAWRSGCRRLGSCEIRGLTLHHGNLSLNVFFKLLKISFKKSHGNGVNIWETGPREGHHVWKGCEAAAPAFLRAALSHLGFVLFSSVVLQERGKERM